MVKKLEPKSSNGYTSVGALDVSHHGRICVFALCEDAFEIFQEHKLVINEHH